MGDPRAFVAAFKTPGNDRKTGLAQKICQQLDMKLERDNSPKPVETTEKEEKTVVEQEPMEKQTEDYILTPDKIYSGAIDPMIGMENIKL